MAARTIKIISCDFDDTLLDNSPVAWWTFFELATEQFEISLADLPFIPQNFAELIKLRENWMEIAAEISRKTTDWGFWGNFNEFGLKVSRPRQENLEFIFGEFTPELSKKFAKLYEKNIAKFGLYELAGASELLTQMLEREKTESGFYFYIVSNKASDLIVKQLNSFTGVKKGIFKPDQIKIIGVDKVPAGYEPKPTVGPFMAIVSDLKLQNEAKHEPSEILCEFFHIGDDLYSDMLFTSNVNDYLKEHFASSSKAEGIYLEQGHPKIEVKTSAQIREFNSLAAILSYLT